MEKVKLKRKVALVLVFSILLGLFQINPLKVEATESIESIEIVKVPTEFTAGELIDRSQIVVKVNYVTGLSEEITNYKIKYIDKYVPKGLKFFVVEYMGFYDSVGITINNPVEDIGLDSEGNPVDLSLWKYKHVTQSDGPGHYELNNSANPAYIGEIVDGAIIGNVPAYINGTPVKGMNYAFSGLNNLTVIPEIPETVETMIGTFKNAINITGVFEVSTNLNIIDDMFLGTTQPITVKIKEDNDISGSNNFGENITIITDRLKSMRVINLNDFKIGLNLSKENMEIELEYESGYTRKITESDKLNHLTFQLEGNGVNLSRILKVYDIGKILTLKYQPYTGSGELITEVIIENLDVFDIEISGVNKTPFSAGETVQNSDLSVIDVIFGDKIESFNIVYPTSALTLDDTYIEVEFQGYKATANINVEEGTIPEPTLGEVIVSYTDTNFAHIKPYDTYHYPTGEEITINAPEIEGYKIAVSQGYSSSWVVTPDEFNTQYVYFTYEPDTTPKGTGTVTIQYYDLSNGIYPYKTTVEMEAGNHSIYATDIPEGYRIYSWETNPRQITVYENQTHVVDFDIEKVLGTVNIEKWVDNNWTYWNTSEQLAPGTYTINASDYYTDSNYVLVGNGSQTVEILEGQTTTVRFDYETPPEGFIILVVKTKDGQVVTNSSFSRPIGEHTINLNDWWGNPLYEVVGSSQKVVEVIEGNTTTVEFTVRKLSTGYVNKIAKYNGEVMWEGPEELAVGEQSVYAPQFSSLYEAIETSQQVVVIEGKTVDVVFNYIKQPSYFVNKVGKDNVSGEVLYFETEEKSFSDLMISPGGFDGENNYDMVGEFWKQVESPQDGQTVELVWLYQKATTGWVRAIGYNEEMVEIYNQLVELRATGGYVNPPIIENYNPTTGGVYVEESSPSPMTPPTVEFYYTLDSKNGGTEPEDSTDYNNQQSDILLTAEPTNFRATVPFKVDIHMSNEGVITVGQGYKIVNECPLGQIVIVDIEITPSNGWSLVDISDDFTNKKINTKEFGLTMNESVALNDGIPLNTSLSESIKNGESKDIVFTAKLAGQTVETNQIISNIVIVLDFWK